MKFRKITCLLFIIVLSSHLDSKAQEKKMNRILIRNVEIFNGIREQTHQGSVLIEGNIIREIYNTSNTITHPEGTIQIIDGKGKFLMPGMIDAHVHMLMESVPKAQALVTDFVTLNFMAAQAAEKQLLRGFTTVRDLGGGALPLANAIDAGLVKGPRIFASGAFISQTGGHGDFGLPYDVPRQIGGELSYLEKNGMAAIADGADAVLIRTREQLRQGATQIKLMAGGGVSSDYDPLDVAQYTEEEIRAAVKAAENWGTYVTVHAYTPKAIKTAIAAGIKCLDHGQLADDSTARLIAKKDIWWSLQPFLDDEDATPFPEGSPNREKQLEMTRGTDTAYALAKKYNIKIAFGTDVLFDAKVASRQGVQVTKMTRWFKPFEILKMVTSGNAALLSMSGKRSPYQLGKLGEITKGAYADLILINGNPLQDINLIGDAEKNFLLIMKDGIVYKNTLDK